MLVFTAQLSDGGNKLLRVESGTTRINTNTKVKISRKEKPSRITEIREIYPSVSDGPTRITIKENIYLLSVVRKRADLFNT